jgi:hypothetical protein
MGRLRRVDVLVAGVLRLILVFKALGIRDLRSQGFVGQQQACQNNAPKRSGVNKRDFLQQIRKSLWGLSLLSCVTARV